MKEFCQWSFPIVLILVAAFWKRSRYCDYCSDPKGKRVKVIDSEHPRKADLCDHCIREELSKGHMIEVL
jgi:hypothetical protein